MDALTIFLNLDINNNIYLEHPLLWVNKRENRVFTDKDVYKLNKALYGLKQSPRF
jgi:hypothetical protein